MTKIKGSGPAFPFFVCDRGPSDIGGGAMYTYSKGMSLRDWFAGMALQGLRANPHAWEELTAEQMVNKAWLDADAMLKARSGEDG